MSERTISRNGFLFRYAYWFMDPDDRPGATDYWGRPKGKRQVSLCRLFWRIVLITFIAMPLWWLVWAPIATAIGFPFAYRPRFFESDWNIKFPENDTSVVPYRHWLRIRGVRILPVWVFFGGLLLWDLMVVNPAHLKYVVAAVVFVIGLVLLGVILFVGFPLTAEKALATEPGRLAKDWVKSKKDRACPLYKVV